MNGTATRFLRLGVSLAGLVTLGWVLTGQAAKPVRHSVPTDWSHRHLIFSHPRSAEQAARVSQDPRYLQQVYRRQQRLALPAAMPDAASGLAGLAAPGSKVVSQRVKRDWSRNLGAGASVGAGNYPAKFSFDTTVAFCDGALPPNQPDYAVFSTGLAGSGTQASIVAYDNLYNGCGGPTPLVYWAYNTGGQILTSPVVSLDGSQVSFVETSGGAGILVTLKWKAANGTVALPATPTLVTSTSGCTTPCMTQTLLKDNLGVQTDDTTSSVYYDYTNDVAWVGGALGWLHKITGLFNGTPTEVTTGGFPVQLGSSAWTSSPVYDRVSNSVFVGDAGGVLYRVNASTGAVTASGQLDFVTGIVEGPIVDSSNGFVYVFASDDGSQNCLDPSSAIVDCAGVFQFKTNFAAGTFGSEASVGSSNATFTPNPLYLGGFDSAYYDSVGPNAATGNLYVCGNTGANPTLYQVPIIAGVLPALGQGSPVSALAGVGSTAACSPVTDVPNENLPGGFSERLFLSVAGAGLPTGCASGCAINVVDAPWTPSTNYAVGQQVLSPKLHIETVMTPGTSALAINSPAWTTQVGKTTNDGPPPSTVVWIDQGAFSVAPYVARLSSHTYGALSHLLKILDSNGNVETLSTVGTTGAVAPAWNTAPGSTTTDGTAIWTNVGPLATVTLTMPGGTSGIIIDNTVGTITIPGDSQIYFSTLIDQAACGTSGAGGCAVQASQPALQ